MGCYSLVPLRVRAWLRTAVVADEWLPLDGILLYQAVRADLGPRELAIPGASCLAQPKGAPLKGGALPLSRVHAKDWYYRCSWAQWGPHADGQDYWNKRFDSSWADLIDFRGRRGMVVISQNAYKAYHMPIYYRSALWVEWYCKGDADRIRFLLAACTHIGKKASQGWGRVMRWEVEPVDQDWSIWQGDKLMRGIPRYHLPEGKRAEKVGIYGVRPPYWDSRNQMELALP